MSDRKFFIAPHNDDETLFGAFTLLRERPTVVIVFDGHVQAERGLAVTYQQRRWETAQAAKVLGVTDLRFLGFDDREREPGGIAGAILKVIAHADHVWIPAVEEGGHHHHNYVGQACAGLCLDATRYLTYTNNGKSTDGVLVKPEPAWIPAKLRALACYQSQFYVPDCAPHFLRSQEEYYAHPNG